MSDNPAAVQPPEKRSCPRCQAGRTIRISECFTRKGDRLCELWYCFQCRDYFPCNVTVDPPAEGVAMRRHTRFAVQFVVQVLFSAHHAADPVLAASVDASAGGICFGFPEEIAVGREGRLRVSLPSVGRPFEVTGRVVRCQPLPDGRWGIAVAFSQVEQRYQAALERYVRLTGQAPTIEQAAE